MRGEGVKEEVFGLWVFLWKPLELGIDGLGLLV